MPLYSVQTGINCLPYITNQPRESSRQTLVDPRYSFLGLVPVNLGSVPASASLAPGIHSSWKKKREGRKKEKRKHPVGDGDDGWVEVAGVCPRNRFLASITQWRALFFFDFRPMHYLPCGGLWNVMYVMAMDLCITYGSSPLWMEC